MFDTPLCCLLSEALSAFGFSTSGLAGFSPLSLATPSQLHWKAHFLQLTPLGGVSQDSFSRVSGTFTLYSLCSCLFLLSQP